MNRIEQQAQCLFLFSPIQKIFNINFLPDPLKRPPNDSKNAAVSGDGPEHSRCSEIFVY